MLLHQYINSKVNQELEIPPTRVLNLDVPQQSWYFLADHLGLTPWVYMNVLGYSLYHGLNTHSDCIRVLFHTTGEASAQQAAQGCKLPRELRKIKGMLLAL